MTYKINELTAEQVKELQAERPQSTIKEYQLVEERPRNPVKPFDVLSYHDSFEEAKDEAKRWQGRDALSDKIQESLDEALELGEQHGVDADEVRAMFKEA